MTNWSGSQGGYVGGPHSFGGPNLAGPAPGGPGGWAPADPTVPAWRPTWGVATPPPGAPPFQAHPGHGYAAFGPPRKSRKPLVFTLVGAIVLIVAVVVGVVVVTSGGSGSKTAGDAVKNYLEALSRGDAEAALSYAVDQPASKDFLTDDILKKQIAKWPISDIRILNDSSFAGTGSVHVAVKFGNQTSDERLSVKQHNGEWKLEQGATKLDIGQLRSYNQGAMKTLTLFGQQVGNADNVYVFPGWIDLDNSNKNIKMEKTSDKALLLNGIPGYDIAGPLSLNFDISDAGRRATDDALRSFLDDCAKSKQLSPPGCPQRVNEPGLVDGTVTWAAPADIGSVTLGSFDAKTVSVRLYGSVKYGISVKTVEGGTRHGVATVFLSGNADLSEAKPRISV